VNVRLDDLDHGGHDGAALLAELHAALGRYVVFPSSEAHDAVTLYVAATHGQPAWEHASRLVLKSPLKRCGKTRAQDVIAETCHRPLRTTNISVAALVRSIDETDPPTLILDEADTVFGKKDKRSEGAEDLRGILNSGHSRGLPYIRWDMNRRSREECSTFAMAVIGGIGDMPDTVEDRAIVVSMRRRAPGEQVAQFRQRRSVPPLHDLRDRLNEWIRGDLDALGDAEPDMPVEDRAADTWEPLVAVADLAGEDWPDRVRKACARLTGENTNTEADTASERLLADLRDIFAAETDLFGAVSKLTTVAILRKLQAIDEAPWADWYGKELSARGLAKLLGPYGIRSKKWRAGDETQRGYLRGDLEDAWHRYVPDPGTQPPQAPQAPQADESAGQPRGGSVADSDSQSATRSDLRERNTVADVADVAQNAEAPVLCNICLNPLEDAYIRLGRTTHPGCRAKTGGSR
jgi:hypothetical protein